MRRKQISSQHNLEFNNFIASNAFLFLRWRRKQFKSGVVFTESHCTGNGTVDGGHYRNNSDQQGRSTPN